MHEITEVPDPSTIPVGFCQCGCGQKTKICNSTDRKRGRIKGVPFRYLQGHAPRRKHIEYKFDESIGYGFCHCGCGQKTAIAKETDSNRKHVKGKPMLFISGHNRRSKKPKYIVDEKSGCWIWQRTKNKKGYGRARDADGNPAAAHQIAYQEANGPIPEGLQIDHLCGNPSCVNPDHLEAVTLTENIRRSRVATIDIEKARLIKSDLKSMVVGEVASKHGVSNGLVSAIKRGVTWRDA